MSGQSLLNRILELNKSWISLKVRYSTGKTFNNEIGCHAAARFASPRRLRSIDMIARVENAKFSFPKVKRVVLSSQRNNREVEINYYMRPRIKVAIAIRCNIITDFLLV